MDPYMSLIRKWLQVKINIIRKTRARKGLDREWNANLYRQPGTHNQRPERGGEGAKRIAAKSIQGKGSTDAGAPRWETRSEKQQQGQAMELGAGAVAGARLCSSEQHQGADGAAGST